jgi:hypothetical protein
MKFTVLRYLGWRVTRDWRQRCWARGLSAGMAIRKFILLMINLFRSDGCGDGGAGRTFLWGEWWGLANVWNW